MAAADRRYLEAWKKPIRSSPSSSSPRNEQPPPPPVGLSGGINANTKFSKDDAKPGHQLNVRLDTPGGVTYSPSELSSHNIVKRTFVPFKLGEGSTKYREQSSGSDQGGKSSETRGAVLPADSLRDAPAYDFGPELAAEDPSEARKYALSIDMNGLAGRPEGGTPTVHAPASFHETAPSVSDRSHLTTASTRTNATVTTLSAARPDGSLPDWYTRTAANSRVMPFIPPPSFTGRAEDAKKPWNAMRWYGHRAFERPSQRDDDRGIAAFSDVNGPGRVPSLIETETEDAIDEDGRTSNSDTRSLRRSVDDARSLTAADLFVVDPRRQRPLRIVRRVDPRQVLLLCNGVCLKAPEVAAHRAAQAARDAGLAPANASSASSNATQELLAKLPRTAEPRGGIGVLFCPNDEPLSQDTDALRAMDPRFEANISKRLEAPPDLVGHNSEARAQLRAVLAALELASWEEEGFDKIVIGVEQQWIVRGITADVWRWRHTGWKLTEHSAQGGPGETVPDRDLWELLDDAVRKYEDIDCNVRFWHVSPRDASLARQLARMGALKDAPQRNGLVRWRKKPALTLVEERERKAKADAASKAKTLETAMRGLT